MATIVDYADFNAQNDCEVLHEAMKGLGRCFSNSIQALCLHTSSYITYTVYQNNLVRVRTLPV